MMCAVNSRYLKVEVHPEILISQSKFSGPRKYFEIPIVSSNISLNVNKIKIENVSNLYSFDTKVL